MTNPIRDMFRTGSSYSRRPPGRRSLGVDYAPPKQEMFRPLYTELYTCHSECCLK